jgi:nucleotide-binding universal stress UspA family protein
MNRPVIIGYDGSEEAANVDFETELPEGPAAEAIVNVADARDPDAMVIGSRGLGRAALGSVSHDVLHLTDRPVVVIPSRKES